MSERCDGKGTGVYRRGNTFALRGGGRVVIRLSHTLSLACLLLLPAAGTMAQPAAAPAEQSATPPAADTESDANMKAEIAAARQQQRTTAATRQQIQAIRAALRARLAALHR